MKMRMLKAALLPAVLLASLAGAWTWYFGGPFRFVESQLRLNTIHYLTATPAWRNYTPLQAADEYLHGDCHPSDRPNLAELESDVDQTSAVEAVVTFINRRCGDDCVSAQCSRLTLRRQGAAWVPVKHEVAWQSRNSFGWSTKTPS